MTNLLARPGLRSFYRSEDSTGLVALPIRLVVGWTYFSALWRRMVLEDKLDAHAAGYVGEKFNNFLPQALGIKPMIAFLVEHPDLLKWSMVAFTIIEGITGLFLMLGLFTRAMSISLILLACGILMGSGWLGTTCLDEWQIGILGISSGLTLFLAGGGFYSADRLLATKNYSIVRRRWFAWLGSGALELRRPAVLTGSLAVLAMALFTNQYFHGGLYGPLYNKSLVPVLEISDAQVSGDAVRFTLYRTEGADTYGSFLVGLEVVERYAGSAVLTLTAEDLSGLPDQSITNYHIAEVETGPHGLVIPLGARAGIEISTSADTLNPGGEYILLLKDVSGAEWSQPIKVAG